MTGETVMIGDTMETDILGATQLGFRAVLVLSGGTKQQDIARFAYSPDVVIDSVADINLDFIREQSALMVKRGLD
ncbi:MAG: hypothetical protein EOP10_30325, partial [Proteobacteria bacterium]